MSLQVGQRVSFSNSYHFEVVDDVSANDAAKRRSIASPSYAALNQITRSVPGLPIIVFKSSASVPRRKFGRLFTLWPFTICRLVDHLVSASDQTWSDGQS